MVGRIPDSILLLLFLISINDLPHGLNKLMSKLFADDTTLYLFDSDIDNLINKFKVEIQSLLNWCSDNKMDINWSKTYFMFVYNSRRKLKIPICISIHKNININVVTNFKLLGVVLDSNLSFSNYISDLCLKINKRLFSIKRLFYLSTAVKIQFFKTFCLPHFDYCISLSIYFSKTMVTKLCKCFYACLFKLFRFNFINVNICTVNTFLKRYGLFSLQYRILYRLSLFFYKLKTQTDVISKIFDIKIRKFNYNLRNPTKYEEPKISNKYSMMELKYVFPKWCNMFKLDIFSMNFTDFKTYLLKNLDFIFNSFIKVHIFSKFDVLNFCNCFY